MTRRSSKLKMQNLFFFHGKRECDPDFSESVPLGPLELIFANKYHEQLQFVGLFKH
jgi:hypothetical protein